MKYLFFCILTLLCATSSYAQENDTLLASAAPHNALPTSELKTEVKEIPDIKVDLNLSLLEKDYLVTPSFDNYWNVYANQPHHTYRIEYDGLYGVIYDQINRNANRFYDNNLKELWDNSALHPLDLDQRIRKYRLEAGDFGNRYWEKRQHFWDYFPIEKGGSREHKITIGDTYEICSFGPVNVTNTGRISLSNWRLTVDRDPDDQVIDRDIVNTDDNLRQDRKATIPNKLKTRDYALGIKPPRGNIYTGDSFSISGSVNINVKLNLDGDNGTAIRGELKIIGFPGMNKKPWFGAYLRVSAKPFREEYSAQLMFMLLQF